MFNKPILERLLIVLSHKFEKLFDLFLVQAKISLEILRNGNKKTLSFGKLSPSM